METAVAEQPKIETGVVKLNITDTRIAELKKDYMGLTVNGIDDKAGLRAVYEARQDVKRTRIGIQKTAKELKEKALDWQKKVNAEEKRVVGELESIEDHLQSEEDKIEAEKERIRKAAEEAENKRIQVRIDALAQYGFAVEYALLKSIDDESFSKVLANAETEHAKEVAAEAERKRIADEETARLKAEREELELLRKKQAEADRILNEERDRQAAEKKKLADQKRDNRSDQLHNLGLKFNGEAYIFEDINVHHLDILTYEDDKWSALITNLKPEIAARKELTEAQEKKRQDQLALDQEAAIAKAKSDAAAKALRDKEENEKAQKEKAVHEAALRPDKEKLEAFAKKIGQSIDFEVSDPKAQQILNDVSILIGKIQTHIYRKVKEL